MLLKYLIPPQAIERYSIPAYSFHPCSYTHHETPFPLRIKSPLESGKKKRKKTKKKEDEDEEVVEPDAAELLGKGQGEEEEGEKGET